MGQPNVHPAITWMLVHVAAKRTKTRRQPAGDMSGDGVVVSKPARQQDSNVVNKPQVTAKAVDGLVPEDCLVGTRS